MKNRKVTIKETISSSGKMVKFVFDVTIYFGILSFALGQSHEYGPPRTQTDSDPSPVYGPPSFIPGQALGQGYGGGGQCMNMDLRRNEQFVMGFYQDSLGGKRVDLLEKYLAPDYLNHSPFSSNPTREDFRDLLLGPLQMAPNQTVDFRRVDAIDDVVWTHSSWVLGGKKYSVMDIWKINCNGQIQEHWDVLQDTNVQTRNPQAFF